MNEQFNATIETNFAELKQLTVAVDEFLQQQHLPGEPIYRIELALEEMLTNVIKYGYDSHVRNEAKITLAVLPEALKLTIEDWGHEFNPMLIETPDLSEDIADRPVGGVGIHLTRSMASQIDYQRDGDRNILIIWVNLDS